MTTTQLLDAIREHSGMDDDQIREAGEHGADAGWPGFTYHIETCKFFAKHQSMIAEMVKDMAEEFGQDPIAFVASFNCIEDDRETRDEIGRCLYGSPTDDDTTVPNALAWFALEEAGRSLDR